MKSTLNKALAISFVSLMIVQIVYCFVSVLIR